MTPFETGVQRSTRLTRKRDEVPQHLLERLAKVADGDNRLRTVTAGYWMANPATNQGHELIAAGLLLIAGPVDGDELIEAVRAGYERGKGSLEGYDPSGSTR